MQLKVLSIGMTKTIVVMKRDNKTKKKLRLNGTMEITETNCTIENKINSRKKETLQMH